MWRWPKSPTNPRLQNRLKRQRMICGQINTSLIPSKTWLATKEWYPNYTSGLKTGMKYAFEATRSKFKLDVAWTGEMRRTWMLELLCLVVLLALVRHLRPGLSVHSLAMKSLRKMLVMFVIKALSRLKLKISVWIRHLITSVCPVLKKLPQTKMH